MTTEAECTTARNMYNRAIEERNTGYEATAEAGADARIKRLDTIDRYFSEDTERAMNFAQLVGCKVTLNAIELTTSCDPNQCVLSQDAPG